jgi:ankyrin repeat protein
MDSKKRNHDDSCDELNDLFKKGKNLGLTTRQLMTPKVEEDKKLIISNLDPSITLQELRELFEICGTIVECSFQPSIPSSASSSSSFITTATAEITYNTQESALEALMEYDGYEIIDDQAIQVRLYDDDDDDTLPLTPQNESMCDNSVMEGHGVGASLSSSFPSSSDSSNRLFRQAHDTTKLLSTQNQASDTEIDNIGSFDSFDFSSMFPPSPSMVNTQAHHFSQVSTTHENFDFASCFNTSSSTSSCFSSNKKKILLSPKDRKVVDWFNTHGFDMNNVTRPMADSQVTPMAHACQRGDLHICEWLYNNGAAADVRTVDSFLSTPMLIACEYDHLEICDWLYHHGAAQDIFSENMEGYTPFTTCISSKKLELINWLYEHGCNETSGVLKLQDRFGFSPLSHACYCGNLEFCQWLISKKYRKEIQEKFKNKKLTNTSTNTSTSSTFSLTRYQNNDLEEEDELDLSLLNLCNNDGESPLMLACKSNQCLVLCQWLIELGANVHLQDTTGKTLLTWICQFNRLEFGQWFMARYGAQINIKHMDGTRFTPLKWACNRAQFCDDIDVVYWMLKLGALHCYKTAENEVESNIHSSKCGSVVRRHREIDLAQVMFNMAPYPKVCRNVLSRFGQEKALYDIFQKLILTTMTVVMNHDQNDSDDDLKPQNGLLRKQNKCRLNRFAHLDQFTGNYLRKEIADYLGVSYGADYVTICQVGKAINNLAVPH